MTLHPNYEWFLEYPDDHGFINIVEVDEHQARRILKFSGHTLTTYMKGTPEGPIINKGAVQVLDSQVWLANYDGTYFLIRENSEFRQKGT